LTKNIKTICFDIDGVICKTIKSNYRSSKPIKKNINIINDFYKKGFIIKIFTARCMGRNFDNIKKAEKEIKKITIKQLQQWNVNYHQIFFGKPSYDLFIDDKSLFFKKNWSKVLKKKIKI
tara:strand:+ start:189 stop:548 length:360 start_codon:yes stop_codon:yes gene_type:complete